MKLSLIFSIYNRLDLLDLGLQSLLKQTMPTEDWEIVIADDMSTKDISEIYKKYPFNITHIQFNPKDHPFYKGYHTASLGLNLAIKAAEGEVICISQPEILHEEKNFELGYKQAMQNKAVFGHTILTHRKFTPWITLNIDKTFDQWWDKANELATPFPLNEFYWYEMYVKREHALYVNGVEEAYMQGVYAEDDEFKDRIKFRLLKVNNLGREDEADICYVDPNIRTIHVNHEHEGDLYPKQDRNANFWRKGAEHNRAMYRLWCTDVSQTKDLTGFIRANKGRDWGDPKYIEQTWNQSL